jgi:sulfhydrogenase subunit gamma (sulfur reductase)
VATRRVVFLPRTPRRAFQSRPPRAKLRGTNVDQKLNRVAFEFVAARLNVTASRLNFMEDMATATLTVTRVRRQARDVRSFDMRREDARKKLAHAPGQVVQLRVGDTQSYFAIASAPEDDALEFLIKRTGGASNDVGGVFYELSEGDRVELSGVVGQGFAVDAQAGRDLVFVAMGTGIAPVRSALRHALARADSFGQLVVLYGARTPEDFCYSDETEAWQAAGVELRQVISRPDGYEWAGQTGYVQSLLDHVLPTLNAPVAFVAGSREMIEHTRDRLQEMGLDAENILTNY